MLSSALLKPVLEVLTAYAIADPDDPKCWSCYSDCCRDFGNHEWADLALKFRGADEDSRAAMIVEHWVTWPPMAALAITAIQTAGQTINVSTEAMKKAAKKVGRIIMPASPPSPSC